MTDQAYRDGKLIMDTKQELADEIERLREALVDITEAMHGRGPLTRDDDADTLDQIGMRAKAALSTE